LQGEPGTHHEYSFCTDVIGRVCEVVSGETLDVFVRQRLLEPLGMVDTHFSVPSGKRKRAAEMYEVSGTQVKRCKREARSTGILSGGGGILSYDDPGMWSTVEDYGRFCQMLLDDGKSLDGRRVLSTSTVRELWKDSLAKYAGPDGRISGWNDYGGDEGNGYWDHHAWTLINTTVALKTPPRRHPPRTGNIMYMYGGAGTGWAIDRKRKMVAVSFAQTFGGALWQRTGSTGCYCLKLAQAAVDELAGGQPKKNCPARRKRT